MQTPVSSASSLLDMSCLKELQPSSSSDFRIPAHRIPVPRQGLLRVCILLPVSGAMAAGGKIDLQKLALER